MIDPNNPPVPLFYFGAQNPPHISLWTDPNAFWGAGMGNGARYVFDQRRPILQQLDYQWAGTYPKRQWDPLLYYRGYPSAPIISQEREGTYMRAQPELNELGYQNVLMRDNGVPIGGEPGSTPQYVFAGPIQAGYTSFMRPIARREQMPDVLPDWRNIRQTQAQAQYGVYGGGPYSDPPLQPPGFATVGGGLGDWPLYQYRPEFPPQIPPPGGADPMMANTNPGQPYRGRNPCPSGYSMQKYMGTYLCRPTPKSPTNLRRSDWGTGDYSPSTRPPGRAFASQGGAARGRAMGYAARNPYGVVHVTPVPQRNQQPREARTMFNQWTSPNQIARATMNNPLSNPMVGGGPGYAGYLNPNMSGMGSMTGYVPNPGIPGVPLTVAPPYSVHGWMRPAARQPNPGEGCGKVCPDGKGLNSNCKGLCNCSVSGQACFCDLDCGTISAAPGGGGMPSRGGRAFATRGAQGQSAGVRGRPKPNCPTGTHRCGSFCCQNLQAAGTGGVARTVQGRRGGAVTQAIVSNPARGGYAVQSVASPRGARSVVTSGGARGGGLWCKMFPGSKVCDIAAPGCGSGSEPCGFLPGGAIRCCPTGFRPGRPGRLSNPGVVPVGTYPQWSGTRSSNRVTIAKAINPHACCDSCAVGGACEGCGREAGACNCTKKVVHHHHHDDRQNNP